MVFAFSSVRTWTSPEAKCRSSACNPGEASTAVAEPIRVGKVIDSSDLSAGDGRRAVADGWHCQGTSRRRHRAGSRLRSGHLTPLRGTLDFTADDRSHGIEPRKLAGERRGCCLAGVAGAGAAWRLCVLSSWEIRFLRVAAFP